MGNAEIQVIEQEAEASNSWARTTVLEVSAFVSALELEQLVFGWNNGSAVSREVHAAFCEKLRVKTPRLTQLGQERQLHMEVGIVVEPQKNDVT